MNEDDRSGELPPELERLLFAIEGPGQYVGGEVNAVVQPGAEVRLALAFPDVYAIGTSHHGSRVLYDAVNRLDWAAAERVFTPWPDMEAALRRAGRPLTTLETFTPLADCDAIGFSLTCELSATNVLTMLDLGGVPLARFDRGAEAPLILGGGHVAFNPEPLSDFFDAFLVGEGDESLPEILRIVRAAKAARLPRAELLLRLAREVVGVYVPALYETAAGEDGFLHVAGAVDGAPMPVKRRIVFDFASQPPPVKPVVPVFESVHERVTLEIQRGCPNGCRFCQAGMVCRPQRERDVPALVAAARECYRHTGYDEIGLLSLSTSDYSRFDELVAALDAEFAPLGVSLSLPSLRVDHALSDIPRRFKTVRRSGLTLAPEAATDRLRAAINKNVLTDHLRAAAREAFAQGWQTLKLYFMLGLPTETDDDVAAVGELATEIAHLRGKRGRGPAVTCSVSNFVPKAHTPLQWEAMAGAEELAAKQALVRAHIRSKKVSYKSHDIPASLLEGALARGDRRLGRVILGAWRLGARLCGWSDRFADDAWRRAFADAGLAIEAYACRAPAVEAPLPWGHIDLGIDPAFLQRERQRCHDACFTPACSPAHCAGCGLERCPIRAT